MSATNSKIFSNTFYQLVGKFFSMAVTVIVTILITRAYGREDYGSFNLMQTWPALVFIIVDFGLNAIAVREISKDQSKSESLFSSILIIRILFSLLFMGIMAILLQFFPYSPQVKFGVALNLFLILTQALYATTNIIFQSRLRYDLSTIGYVAGYIFIIVAAFLMTSRHIPVAWISFAYVIGGLITYGVNYAFIKKLGLRFKFELNKNLIKYLMIQSLPLGLMFVFSQLNFKSDAILLSILKLPGWVGLNNTESLAIYSLPYKVFEVALVLPTFFMNSFYPVLLQNMNLGRDKLKHSLTKAIKYMISLGLISAIIGVIFSDLAISVLGGTAFAQSVLVLQILLSFIVLYFVTQPIAWLIVSLDKQAYLVPIYFVSAVFNITANYLVIPKYSFYGSAVITHLSELLILFLLIFYAKKAWRLKYGN